MLIMHIGFFACFHAISLKCSRFSNVQYMHIYVVCVRYIRVCVCMYSTRVYVYACTVHASTCMHVLNERLEGRKKEASKVKQINKAKQHSTPKAVTFPRKMSCLRWDSNPRHSIL